MSRFARRTTEWHAPGSSGADQEASDGPRHTCSRKTATLSARRLSRDGGILDATVPIRGRCFFGAYAHQRTALVGIAGMERQTVRQTYSELTREPACEALNADG